ncbi:MAG: ABC transporter substrate-binding protein [Xanthobacteraceae bacterium]
MRRREFIAGLGGAVTWPLSAHAQQPATPVVGYLSSTSPAQAGPYLAAIRQGLSEVGYIEGQNVAIEYRWANGQFDRMPALAVELVDRRVNVIVTSISALAVKAATATIPIVSTFGSDPVKLGVVASLNRPGGNITGVVLFSTLLGPKRLELLRELLPSAKIIAVLVNPSNPVAESRTDLIEVEAAARAAGQQLSILNATNARDFEPAFAAMHQQGVAGLLVMADPIFNSRRELIVALAMRHAIPAIYEWREFSALGGLMSYGSSLTDASRQIGVYAGKILKGVKPADLPIIQATKVELVINLKTAKTLGLTFPITLLGRADEVIE